MGFGRVGCIASGAMWRCCGLFGGSRWRGCGRRLSRWSSGCWLGLFTRWQGVVQPRRGLDALLDVIENLQGAPLPASVLETEILPARLAGYKSSDLDMLIAAGEVVWVGMDPIGERDGRVGLYLAEKLPVLWQGRVPEQQKQNTGVLRSAQDDNSLQAATKEEAIVAYLQGRGASFFQDLHEGVGGGYPGETLEALWGLVWKGMVDE